MGLCHNKDITQTGGNMRAGHCVNTSIKYIQSQDLIKQYKELIKATAHQCMCNSSCSDLSMVMQHSTLSGFWNLFFFKSLQTTMGHLLKH